MKSCPCGPTGPSYAADGSPARESPTSGVQTARFVSLSAALLPGTSIDGVIDDDAKNACMTTKQTILRVPGSRNAPTFQGKRRIVAYSTPAQPRDDFRAELLLNAQPQSHQPPNGTKMRRTAPPPGLPRRPPNSCSFRNHTFGTTACGQTATFSQQGMPQKTSSKQKFPPQGVKQLPTSKPAFQQTSQSPSLFPNALLPTTEHQCTNHWGLDSWGRGSANAMKESTIETGAVARAWRPWEPRPAASNGHHAQ